MIKTAYSPLFILIIISIIAFLLLAACTSDDAGVEDGVLRFTFDGEDCIYEGPTTLKAGPVTFVFVNESEGLAEVVVPMLDEDKTIQDMIDYIGEEPSTGSAPYWAQLIILERADPGESLSLTEVLEPGIYTPGCGRVEPFGAWFGTGLTVEE